MKLSILSSAIIVLIAALFAVWFFTTHEKVVIEIPATYQGEARFNDLFAAELLLRELAIDADSRSSLLPSEWLPEPSDTLLVRASPALAATDERELLQRWVVAGGHLVILAPAQSTRLTEDFFDYFGYRVIEIDPAAEGRWDDAVVVPETDTGLESIGYAIDAASATFRLESTGDGFAGATLSDVHGIFAARRAWGGGVVTAIAGSMLFGNRFLAESDHARLLLDSVAGHVEPRKVWLVYEASFPPLWQLVWDHAPYAVSGIALAVLVWLWSTIPRFGPLMSPARPERRSIIEHVRAAGQFLWRYDGAKDLAAGSAATVVHRADSMHSGIGRLPLAEQAALIGKLTRRPARVVLDALEPRDHMGQREFTQRIRMLQALREEL
jgi:hypothetical protein